MTQDSHGGVVTYYITKYALSNAGRLQQRTGPSSVSDGLVYFSGDWTGYTLGRDIFTDKDEALAAVLTARDKKIASLEKQIAKLRKIGGAE